MTDNVKKNHKNDRLGEEHHAKNLKKYNDFWGRVYMIRQSFKNPIAHNIE